MLSLSSFYIIFSHVLVHVFTKFEATNVERQKPSPIDAHDLLSTHRRPRRSARIDLRSFFKKQTDEEEEEEEEGYCAFDEDEESDEEDLEAEAMVAPAPRMSLRSGDGAERRRW